MFFSLRERSGKLLLWLLALAVLGFVATLFPEIERALFGGPDPRPPS